MKMQPVHANLWIMNKNKTSVMAAYRQLYLPVVKKEFFFSEMHFFFS